MYLSSSRQIFMCKRTAHETLSSTGTKTYSYSCSLVLNISLSQIQRRMLAFRMKTLMIFRREATRRCHTETLVYEIQHGHAFDRTNIQLQGHATWQVLHQLPSMFTKPWRLLQDSNVTHRYRNAQIIEAVEVMRRTCEPKIPRV